MIMKCEMLPCRSWAILHYKNLRSYHTVHRTSTPSQLFSAILSYSQLCTIPVHVPYWEQWPNLYEISWHCCPSYLEQPASPAETYSYLQTMLGTQHTVCANNIATVLVSHLAGISQSSMKVCEYYNHMLLLEYIDCIQQQQQQQKKKTIILLTNCSVA